jgi:hypothetical protein
MCEKYNGWSNYPTWCVKLWIDNDQGLYDEVNQMAQDCYDNAEANSYLTKEELARCDFADELEDYIQELRVNFDGTVNGMSADLLGFAIGLVDWYEIAAAIIEDNVTKEDDSTSGQKCICVDLINCNPDPSINPDCPIHGTLEK